MSCTAGCIYSVSKLILYRNGEVLSEMRVAVLTANLDSHLSPPYTHMGYGRRYCEEILTTGVFVTVKQNCGKDAH